jgi:hypothetical protein
MSDDLDLLRRRVGSLRPSVGDFRNRLLNCLQVAHRPEDSLTLARGLAESLCKQILERMAVKPPAMLDWVQKLPRAVRAVITTRPGIISELGGLP